tara:strand:+ start:13 stop:1011 length:999 start_codon:yes stop_codon:yes gene_type:complete
MLNVAVIGLGVGKKHADIYNNNSRCKLAGIFDFDSKKINWAKKKYPGIRIYSNDSEIFNDENIDIVSIASYDNYHCKQILKGLEKNKHLMIEKPICLNKSELIQIFRAKANKENLKLSSNFVLRSSNLMKNLKNDIKSSSFGDLYYAEADYLWGRIKKLDGWRSKMDYYSVILGAAIHMIDAIMWIFESKPVSVYATENKIGSKKTKLKYGSFAIILLKFPNNLIVKITGNGPCVHPHFHEFKIFGSEKTFIHNHEESYFLSRSPNKIKKTTMKNQNSYNQEKNTIITSFIDSIINPNSDPIVKQNEIFDVMSVCFAAEKSIKIKKPVSVEY